MQIMKGINLGGWLILEKWITPSLFEGTTARDEWSLAGELGYDEALKRLDRHRGIFITEADIAWIASRGFDYIRVPIGYWVFGDDPNYIGCVTYLDAVFVWAERYGLKVVISLHGAPGAQNASDHSGSGRQGYVNWHLSQDHIVETLIVLRRITRRYKDSSALYGIGVLNEPGSDISLYLLSLFYKEAYRTIREESSTVKIIVSDSFQPERMVNILQRRKLDDVMIDMHLYQVFGTDRYLSFDEHIKKVAVEWLRLLESISRYHPVMVGEWSAALDLMTFKGQDAVLTAGRILEYFLAQQETFAKYSTTWCYWTYKTEDGGPWSYKDNPSFRIQ